MIVPRIVEIEQPQACDECRFRFMAVHAFAHLPGLAFVGCSRGDCDNWKLPGREVTPSLPGLFEGYEPPLAPDTRFDNE